MNNREVNNETKREMKEHLVNSYKAAANYARSKANEKEHRLNAYNNAKNQQNRYSSLNGTRQVPNQRSFTRRLFGSPTKLYKNSNSSRGAALEKTRRNMQVRRAKRNASYNTRNKVNLNRKSALKLNAKAAKLRSELNANN